MSFCTGKKLLTGLVSASMAASALVPFTAFAAETKAADTKTTTTQTTQAAPAKQATDEKTIQILSINDFHGAVTDESETGKNMGMAKVINAVKTYKEQNPNTLVVSAGDNYQGTAMSNLTYGAPVSEMFKEMGLLTSAVGNHEFDWGIDHITKWEKDGGFNFLTANIIDKTTGKPVEWANPYMMVEQDGVKIGFFGLTTQATATTTLPKNVEKYEFKDLQETAKEWTAYLKSGKAPEGKADVVIALTHLDSYQNAETKAVTGDVLDSGLCNVEGLDAVITAHSHQTVAGYINDVAVVQGYYNGRCLGKLTLTLDVKNNLKSIVPEVDVLYNRKSELISDSAAVEVFNKYNAELQPILGEVVGKTATGFDHSKADATNVTELGYWTSDIIRKKVDAQIGLMNQGGLRTNIPVGDITMGKLYEVMPFDNTIVKLEITGEQLKKNINNGIQNPKIGWVEVAGLKVTYDMSKEFGDRVVTMSLEDGTPIQADKMYSVATNNFMADNGDGYDFTGAKNKFDTNLPLRDAVIEVIKEKGEVSIKNFESPLQAIKKVSEAALLPSIMEAYVLVYPAA